MKRPEDYNGSGGRELDRQQDHIDESVYCVNCGNIYVPDGNRRECPTCAVAKMIQEQS